MDGYSVKDAAVVLGIPERRVWELLARGVLAGAPEGPDGMIVYLQPRGAPPSAAPSQGAPRGSSESTGAKVNGNGGSHELSPFRELLTEFRNLTERYGQALLALGEARGEVASLRGRVELLEARMDLRLPSPPTSTVAWEIPEFASEDAAASSAFGAAASAADQAAAAEFQEALAGEDEPAAEPMIDLVEEAILAEELLADELLADEEPIVELLVEEIADDPAAAEPVLGEAPAEELAPEAAVPDTEAISAVEGEPPHVTEAEPESIAAAIPPEPAEVPDDNPETPRKRTRGGRTATAAFAAALARADDPTIAELPGAEETAAALAALQRDIDASRAPETLPEAEGMPGEVEAITDAEAIAEPEPQAVAEPEPEPQAVAEPEHEPVAEAEPEPEAITELAAIEEGTAPVATEAGAPFEEVPAEAATPEPPQPSVPSYYTTDVVEPDWFADGDFSWLEAAQAEAMRIEAEQSLSPEATTDAGTGVTESEREEEIQESDPEPLAGAEEIATYDAPPEPIAAPATSPDEVLDVNDDTGGNDEGGNDEGGNDEGGDIRPAATDIDEATGIAAELAFGDHPDTDVTPPDVGHDRFEPSVESQAIAEQAARTAIQDAFEEAPDRPDDDSPIGGNVGVAMAAAVAEPIAEPVSQAEIVGEPEVVEEPEAVADDLGAPPVVEDAPAEMADLPGAVMHDDSFEAEAEPEANAIQDAFEPPDQPAEEIVRSEHEAEAEAAIQEAFDEPAAEPNWSDDESGETSTLDDQPYPNEAAPRASDDSPRTAAAAVSAAAFRGPEEFIAPAPPPASVAGTVSIPAATQPTPTSGEEELMWLGEEFEAADLEVAAEGWRSPEAVTTPQAAMSPVLELSDAELAQLAADEGWDAEEVEAIRRLLGRPSDAPLPDSIPPATPTGDAGLEASSSSSEPSRPSSGGSAGPPPPTIASSSDSATTSGTPQPWSPGPPANASGTGTDQPHDPEWLQGRSGAAVDAYRRLRKLFPS